MLSFYDRATIEGALALSLDSQLHNLLASRIANLTARGFDDLIDMTHFLVIEAGDTQADIELEVGFSPLVNATDGTRFGSIDFHPSWDWLQYHDGWFELIVTVGNSGFAFVLLIQDVEGVDPELLKLCRTHCA